MSRQDLDQFLEQLASEDAPTRVEAAKQLAALERPESIPRLVEVYQTDSDKNVRNAAAAALKSYRAMEARMSSSDDDGKSGGLLPRLRLLLIIVLVLSIIGNIALFVPKLIGNSGGGTSSGVLSGRDNILAAYTKQVTDANTAITKIRSYYVAAEVAAQLPCAQTDQDAVKSLDPVSIDDADNAIYPDLGPLEGQINDMVGKVNDLRTEYLGLCAITDPKAQKDKIVQLGGAPKLVESVDLVSNQVVKQLKNSVQGAIANPAATSTATFTATSLPTDTLTPTVPTDTPAPTIPGSTAAPTAIPSKGPDPAATTATTKASGPTSVPNTPTPSTLVFSSSLLGLESMTSYDYKLVVSYSRTLQDASPVSGSIQEIFNEQASPFLEQVQINMTDLNLPTIADSPLKGLGGGLFILGISTYILTNNKLYQTGAVLGANPKSACAVLPSSSGNLGRINGLIAAKILAPGSISMTRVLPDQQVDNYTTSHYHGETNRNGEFDSLDVFMTQDAKPFAVNVTFTKIMNYGNATATLPPAKNVKITYTYDLQKRNIDLGITVPLICTQ